MGSEDARLREDALSALSDESEQLAHMHAELKERNAMLRAQNADLKDFLKHMHDELTSFLQYNAIKKEL